MSGIGGQRPMAQIMSLYFSPLDACLQQGGDGGVSITARRLACQVMRTPSPAGNVTARPADVFGQRYSR